jgi:hypothetical protein
MVGCTTATSNAGIIATGSMEDQLFESAGYNKVFLPFLANKLRSLNGDTPIENPISVYDSGLENLKKHKESNTNLDAVKTIYLPLRDRNGVRNTIHYSCCYHFILIL